MSSELLLNGLKTKFDIQKQDILHLNSKFFFHGSCFSENIAKILHHTGFSVQSNPHGILYNPASMGVALEKIASKIPYTENDLTYFADQFVSLDHHGTFADSSAQALCTLINKINTKTFADIAQAGTAVLTFGTAWVWEFNESGKITGNCHRLPGHAFNRRLLSEQETGFHMLKCIQYLRMINPEIKILLTISPVKHLKEGIIQNLQSKSRLISALTALTHKDEQLIYFPAFEIVTEELRDHRFYAEDLAHPSNWTIEYIFRRFIETHFDERGLQFVNKSRKYFTMLNHRLMDNRPANIQKWQAKLAEERNILLSEFNELKNPDLIPKPPASTAL
jgi:hypothetical protein